MAWGGRAAVAGALGVLCLLAALFATWDLVAPPVIRAFAAGHTLAPLDAWFEAHRRADPLHRDVDYYVRNGRTALGRAVILAAGAALATLALVRRRQVAAAARAYLTASGPALNLAVFRVVVFVMFLLKVEWTPVAFYAQLPPVLLMPPPGLGWLARLLPMSPEAVQLVLLVFRVSCVLAIVGLFTRAATVVALLSGAYAIALPQLWGKLYADHHILWFAALLAVSACGDALSLDAWRARRRGAVPPPPSPAYAFPLRMVWLLLGVIYFFPGFWKVWRTGFAWISAENMQHHLFLKWRELGSWTPPLRIDGYPSLLFLSALGTVAFELGFIVLVVSARTRPLAAAAGLVFHNLTWLLMRISFWVLQLPYAALIDWDALLRRVRRRPTPVSRTPAPASVPWATAAIGAVLVAGAVATGSRLVALSWPFTAYPSFASLAGTTLTETSVRAIDSAGRDREVDLRRLNAGLPRGFEDERLQGLVEEAMATPDPALRERRLRAAWSVLAPGDPALHDARVVRFYRDTVTAIPERRGDNPLTRELVLELYAADPSVS